MHAIKNQQNWCLKCCSGYYPKTDGQCYQQSISNCYEHVPNKNKCAVCVAGFNKVSSHETCSVICPSGWRWVRGVLCDFIENCLAGNGFVCTTCVSTYAPSADGLTCDLIANCASGDGLVCTTCAPTYDLLNNGLTCTCACPKTLNPSTNTCRDLTEGTKFNLKFTRNGENFYLGTSDILTGASAFLVPQPVSSVSTNLLFVSYTTISKIFLVSSPDYHFKVSSNPKWRMGNTFGSRLVTSPEPSKCFMHDDDPNVSDVYYFKMNAAGAYSEGTGTTDAIPFEVVIFA